MGLGEGGQGPEDRGLVGVDVGQRGHGRARAGGTRTTTGETHRQTVPPASPPATRLAVVRQREARSGGAAAGAATAAGAACMARCSPALPRRRARGATPPEVFARSCSAWSTTWRPRWHDELGLIEFAVEETPIRPRRLGRPHGPAGLAGARLRQGVDPAGALPAADRVRCETRSDLAALVLTVLVEQVSKALLGRSPEEIDPRYDAD